jgi:hypothetical protein
LTGDAPLWRSEAIIAIMAVAAYGTALRLVSIGFKLRT